MKKLPALAAALMTLAAMTSGCVVDMVATADLPNATILAGRKAGPVIVRGDDGPSAPARRGVPLPTAASSDARNPVIHSFTANPGNYVPAGQAITFQVVAHDPGNQPMQFNWSATGGTLTSTSGQLVVWNPPDKPGLYTVSTIVTNARGGAVSGSQNLIVQADGSVKQAAQPVVEPKPEPKAEPKVDPKPAPKAEPIKPAPAPVADADPCGCHHDDDHDVAQAGEIEPAMDDGMEADMADADMAAPDDEGFAAESWTRFAKK